MRKALIIDGRVREVLDSGNKPFPPFHPEMNWVECGAGVNVGDVYANGAFSAYVATAKTQAEINAEAIAELAVIDAASIRAMREYIAAKPDAPQFIKNHETAAQAARAKLA